MDPGAPNLQIRPLTNAIEALARSSAHRQRLAELEQELRTAWGSASPEILGLFDDRTAATVLCATYLASLRQAAPGRSLHTLKRINQLLKDIEDRIRSYEEGLYNERLKLETRENRELIGAKLYALRQFQEPLQKLRDFTVAPDFALVRNNRLFLKGSWGTGKTHLLCDVVNSRMAESLPTLLLLANTFRPKVDPLVAACEVSGLARTPDALFRALDRLGKQTNTRALLLIDGINEGDRAAWRRYLGSAIKHVRRYRNVALILSCRVPFDDQILTARTRGAFVEVTHSGFTDIEFDAQKEFFRHYKIPAPHIPLLAPEFSRPLFLKILCESIASLTRSAKQRRINDFAAGHKGMTKLLEDFVARVGKRIEQDFGLPGKCCWRLLKGQGDGASAIGIAVRMAEQGRDYISRSDCLAIIARTIGTASHAQAEEFLARLITDGLLAEDGVHHDGVWSDIIRLPYQRFSDHLISRHLLARYLKTGSEAEIRSCFHANQPLGRIFKPDRWGRSFAMPGLVSAVMLEFPERVKRTAGDKRELLAYLPSASQTDAIAEPFIEGLLWRNTDSFCTQTNHIVSMLLNSQNQDVQQGMLEALVCLASRNGHPYSAQRLYKYLAEKMLAERDLFWSEFLRSRDATSAMNRVMDWIQISEKAAIGNDTAANLICLCALFLTTTVRTLRDRATHCLVLLGELYPAPLFEASAASLSLDDPYIPERMLAASYGVLMRKWAFPPAGLADVAVTLAINLRGRLAGSDDIAPIVHILMRDYAEGIIELASKLSPANAPRLSLEALKVSKRTRIPSGDRIADDRVKAASAGIHMDFDNYTTGRLVENRANYDSNHKEYRQVQRQIRWRMLDLGYDPERFKHVDRGISESNFRMGRQDGGKKVDRYGKKYSWIAFYEVAGLRRVAGTLPNHHEPRISDTDIDPSFPDAPLKWCPPVQPLFNSAYRSAAAWMGNGPSPDYRHLLMRDEVDGVSGPWVLLQGYINEAALKDPREAFTFLRGLFVAEADLSRLESTLASKDYPGNHQIPEPGEDYYLFAGEIGWSRKFGSSLRDADGRASRQLGEAFDHTEHRVIEKPYGMLTDSEKAALAHPGLDALFSGENSAASGANPSPGDIIKVQEWVRIPGVTVEQPAWRFAWESYHSEENTGGHPDYPAPALVDALGLRKIGASVDLAEAGRRVATLYREWGNHFEGFRADFLYLRADLVEKYLGRLGLTLAWINWGERSLHHDTLTNLRESADLRTVWDTHAHIHKQFAVYRDGKVG
jgi:hypothetical protein